MKKISLFIVICVAMLTVACKKEEVLEQKTNKPLDEIEQFERGEATYIKESFEAEGPVIWYYADKCFNDGTEQVVDEFTIIDTIYRLENGNATIYHLDEEFALQYDLGTLEAMSDGEIVELLNTHKQSDELRLEDIRQSELALNKDIVQQDILNYIQETYVDGKLVESLYLYSGLSNLYYKYIDSVRRFDSTLYRNCPYEVKTIYDKNADVAGANLIFSYKKALTIPVLMGVEFVYDENGKVNVEYIEDTNDILLLDDGVRNEYYVVNSESGEYYIESHKIEDEVLTLVNKQEVLMVGDSEYEGFIVENTNEYTDKVYRSGWLIQRKD